MAHQIQIEKMPSGPAEMENLKMLEMGPMTKMTERHEEEDDEEAKWATLMAADVDQNEHDGDEEERRSPLRPGGPALKRSRKK